MRLEGFTEQIRVEQAVSSFMGEGRPNSTLAYWPILEE